MGKSTRGAASWMRVALSCSRFRAHRYRPADSLLVDLTVRRVVWTRPFPLWPTFWQEPTTIAPSYKSLSRSLEFSLPYHQPYSLSSKVSSSTPHSFCIPTLLGPCSNTLLFFMFVLSNTFILANQLSTQQSSIGKFPPQVFKFGHLPRRSQTRRNLPNVPRVSHLAPSLPSWCSNCRRVAFATNSVGVKHACAIMRLQRFAPDSP